MAEILSQNDKRSALEREVSELRSKLLIAENEMSQIETSEKVAKTLEQEVQRVREEISQISKERDELLDTVSSLHQRMREVDNSNGFTKLTAEEEQERDMLEDEEERMAKNREAYLNVMLLKAKQEKLKAIKLIVNLLGKETVQSLLKSSSTPVSSPGGKTGMAMTSAVSPMTVRDRKSLGGVTSSSSPNLYATPTSSSGGTRRRSPTRSNSLFAEELMNADSPSPANTTSGNDLLDRLIDALSSPRARSKSRYALR